MSNETKKPLFFAESLGPGNPIPWPRVGEEVHVFFSSEPSIQRECEPLYSALNQKEKLQFIRMLAFCRMSLDAVRKKYAAPEYEGVIISYDNMNINFPERVLDNVMKILILILRDEFSKIYREHNGTLNIPERFRTDRN